MNKALMATCRRAETRPDRLSESFVEVDVLETLLQNPGHQVLFGRRGTGKTHILYVLKEIVERDGDLAIIVDMRTIASTGAIFEDDTHTLADRGTRLLKDVIAAIETVLADHVLAASYERDEDFTACMRALDALAEELTRIHMVGGSIEQAMTTTVDNITSTDTGLTLTLSSSPISAGFKDTASQKQSRTDNLARSGGVQRENVHFRSIQDSLSKVVALIPAPRVWILLDEWTDVPTNLQPALAEFLRRCLLPVQGITVKIGAIEKRAHFLEPRPELGDYLGFELGADVAGDADLDDFFCDQRDDDRDGQFMEDLIYNHVRVIDPTLVRQSAASELIARLLPDRGAFNILIEAAAGVPRDALNILSIAAQRAGTKPITLRLTRDAIRTWYKRDKLGSLAADVPATELFFDIVRRVIGDRRHSSFLLRDPDLSNRQFNRLFDARLIHLVKRDIPSQTDVTLRYSLFRIDAGAYVDLPHERLPKLTARYVQHTDYPVIYMPAK